MKSGFYEKAKRGIDDAEMLFNAERYEAAANRAYYACFHAAIALLKRFGIEHPKHPHDWIQAQFSAEIIHRRKIFPKALASSLPNIQTVRHLADYREESISKSIVAKQLKEAKVFYNSLTTYLEQTP
ncbi:MAG: HEPN domain-containing protein [Candidatus Kapaibacterium sp.]|nr:MAG: HEPN domain-containing protein [Candidatus Kapabacteria bacterium]